MSGIQAQIELNDHFSSVLNYIVNAVNLAAAAEPVEVPVHWEVNEVPVFTGTGADRFRQEVQSADTMLEQLCNTQNAIAKQAYKTMLFPPEAFQNLNTLAVRIDTVRERIQQIESNPVNIGTDTANAELERLRGSLGQMVQEQAELNSAMQNKDVSAANDAYLRLSQTVGGTERYIRDNVDEQGRFNQEIQAGAQQTNGLTNMIKKVAGAYINVQNAGKVLDISDELTQATMRLDLMNDGLQSTPELVNMVYAAARSTHAPFLETADAIAKMGNEAGGAFGSNAELIAFMDQANKQFAIGGAGAEDQAAAMEQLRQAMAAGTFSGNELNSVLAAAPQIAGAIEQSMGWAEGSVMSYAQEGAVTAEVVKNALLSVADETNAAYENVPVTFSQMMTDLKSGALKAFQPLLQGINDIVNSEIFQSFADGAVEALGILAGMATDVFDMMMAAGGFIADNWSIIEPLILGVAAALAAYGAYLVITEGIEMASTAIKTVMCVASYAHAAATGAEASSAAIATAAQYGFNAALLACPVTWIVIAIIALIAIIYAAVAAFNKFTGESVSATGLIMGAFAVLAAHILNTFVIPVINGFAMFANFIGNVFHNPIAAIKVLFYDMCLNVIGYIQNLAHGIETLLNKIPGVTVNITSGLDSLYAELAEAQQAVKDESGWIEYVGKIDYIDDTGAMNAGYEFGAGIEETVSNFNLSDIFGSGGLPGSQESPLKDLASQFAGVVGNPGADDSFGGITEGMSDNLGSIAGDTGAIKDSMDITQEDLKYLRDIAEQEAINRFTTAEIHVDMSGMSNTVNSGDDLDGFMSKLTDSVYEAVDNMTEGVHA